MLYICKCSFLCPSDLLCNTSLDVVVLFLCKHDGKRVYVTHTCSKSMSEKKISKKIRVTEQLFHVRIYFKIFKKKTYLQLTHRLFCQAYIVASLYTLYLTISGIIIPSLKSIEQF